MHVPAPRPTGRREAPANPEISSCGSKGSSRDRTVEALKWQAHITGAIGYVRDEICHKGSMGLGTPLKAARGRREQGRGSPRDTAPGLESRKNSSKGMDRPKSSDLKNGTSSQITKPGPSTPQEFCFGENGRITEFSPEKEQPQRHETYEEYTRKKDQTRERTSPK